MNNPIDVFNDLKEQMLSYYDTPFGLADQSLMQERRKLLNDDGGCYREPIFELRPTYKTASDSIEVAGAEAGLDPEDVKFLTSGLLPESSKLYTHQDASLRSSLNDGHLVFTPGTGSGKTESFLLPIFAQLLRESKQWTISDQSQSRWWKNRQKSFEPSRRAVESRPAAVRSLILYPMNALVDDQLVRLRRSLDGLAACRWLDENRNGSRFYFGRYTGATPVYGSRDNTKSVSTLREILSTSSDLIEAIDNDAEERFFVQKPYGSEMISRWDMLDFPPDILITNYSMLNVMMQRSREESLFQSTRDWLDSSSENVFTLVMDEMHTYRGTAGTEVSYIVRNLIRRLALYDRPRQLRVIAASASLNSSRDEKFLADFFGLPLESFTFVNGEIERTHPDATTIEDFAAGNINVEATSVEVLGPIVERAFFEESDPQKTKVRTLSELGATISPQSTAQERDALAKKVVSRISSDGSGSLPKLRSHMFFRNVAGMWACCDPTCRLVEDDFRSARRTVGKLYSNPTTKCECGSRVLELLYCQGCGYVMLGGFALTSSGSSRSLDVTLLPDFPDLQNVPDKTGTERTAENYRVYWPSQEAPVSLANESQKSLGVEYRFSPVKMHQQMGRFTGVRPGEVPDGWLFEAKPTSGSRSLDSILPFPICCPHCDDDWRILRTPDGALKGTDTATMRSPIRTMRTGFEKVNQVLVTSLMRNLVEDKRKCVVFTDSRQDAAKLSSGIGLNHYQDLVRALLNRRIRTGNNDTQLVSDAKSFFVEERWDLALRYADFRAKWPNEADEISTCWKNGDDRKAESLLAAAARPATIREVSQGIFSDFLRIGANPAGPKADVQYTDVSGLPTLREPEFWATIFDWTKDSPIERNLTDSALRNLRDLLYDRSEQEVISSVASGSGRDIESIGIGWIDSSKETKKSDRDSKIRGAAQASLRILAQKKRFVHLRDESERAPKHLKRYWAEVARQTGLGVQELEDDILAYWGSAVVGFLLKPDSIYLHVAPEKIYECLTCTRQHVLRGFGICSNCFGPLAVTESPNKKTNDYYAANAAHDAGVFKLNCAELTGQTAAKESQVRQASFQNIFLGAQQVPRVDALELLSVTTTMEAGVDIGALDVVVMGNMPPTRFNYQQRVGRAGRRGANIAMALTVCRPRSHDEHYFSNPKLIVSEPTPAPYLAMTSEKIAKRVISAEILRLAFLSASVEDAVSQNELEQTRNTHGQYGYAADWPLLEEVVEFWVQNNLLMIADNISEMFSGTPLHEDIFRIVQEASCNLFLEAKRITENGFIGHSDLSQRLAENGVLPMFGFPTRSRQLFLGVPEKSSPWPPQQAIDRDGPMAISAFAPGSELIKDGWIYKTSGVAAWDPSGYSKPKSKAFPFSEEQNVLVCRRCSHLKVLSTAPEVELACSECGAEPGIVNALKVREPLGYYAKTAGSDKRPFDGNFAWTPNAMHARARADFDKLIKSGSMTISVHSGSASKYIINDNRGKNFLFSKSSKSDIYYSTDSEVEDGMGPIAIGLSQISDFAFFGAEQPSFKLGGNSWSLHLSTEDEQLNGQLGQVEGKRAAWYSLSFLLREVAASFLDVQPIDLSAGIISTHVSGIPSTFAFITDTIENGAGFSTRVASSECIEDFVIAVEDHIERHLITDNHSQKCKGSCYKCIRDYQNMAFHPILDWKLAVDLFKLIRHESIGDYLAEIREVSDRWTDSFGGILKEFEGSPFIIFELARTRSRVAVIPHHPFEDLNAKGSSPRLKSLFDYISSDICKSVVFADSLIMDRTPSAVMSMINSVK